MEANRCGLAELGRRTAMNCRWVAERCPPLTFSRHVAPLEGAWTVLSRFPSERAVREATETCRDRLSTQLGRSLTFMHFQCRSLTFSARGCILSPDGSNPQAISQDAETTDWRRPMARIRTFLGVNGPKAVEKTQYLPPLSFLWCREKDQCTGGHFFVKKSLPATY